MKKQDEATKQSTEFAIEVVRLLRKLPHGKVVTFGQLAAMAGKPHGGRNVGWILKTQSKKLDLPWQRVLNAGGKLFAPPGSSAYKRQKKLLKAEDVAFRSAHYVDLANHQWHGPNKKMSASRPRMFSR